MLGLLVPLCSMQSSPKVAPKPEPNRWVIEGQGIVWKPKASDVPHSDTIETSGLAVSLLMKYGTKEGGKFYREVRCVWPQLRTIPNNTHGSLQHGFTFDETPALYVDGKRAEEVLVEAKLDGLIRFRTRTKEIQIDRTMIASTSGPWVIEDLKVTNLTRRDLTVELSPVNKVLFTDVAKSVSGQYKIETVALMPGGPTLKAGGTVDQSIFYLAGRSATDSKRANPNIRSEIKTRESRVSRLSKTMVLDTPSAEINQMFSMAKVRAVESIFQTKNGKVHCPGGGPYYAAIWANDQAEYSGPLFGMLDDKVAQEAGGTAYEWFAKYMNPEYKPIPSSIVAEGDDSWNGAGDRGDMAMIAYGASRYVLAKGDRAAAEKHWPLIAWCLEYLKRHRTPDGVIASDSDELEGRFPAGKANLNTAALTYDALLSAASLAENLGKSGAQDYRMWAKELRAAIEKHFGAKVESFDTYRYYEENTVLRAWICTPLTMGIMDRTKGTLDALFSPRLWTIDGLATQAGEKTFWDRATLYGFRGALQAGETERVMPFLSEYVNRRTLGEHVPYAIEAWPEGNQRHLSAESALFVRVFTEGLFGLRPTGLRSFEVLPRLPRGWDKMSLRKVWIGGQLVDLSVKRDGTVVRLDVHAGGKTVLKADVGGKAIVVKLP